MGYQKTRYQPCKRCGEMRVDRKVEEHSPTHERIVIDCRSCGKPRVKYLRLKAPGNSSPQVP